MVHSRREIPLDWFRCPVTKELLTHNSGELYSSHGVYKQNPVYGFWNFLPTDFSEFENPHWKAWRKLQDNGTVSYENSPTENLGIGRRSDFLAFADFCDFHGNVLDVGVGPQRCPTHIEFCVKKDVFFLGIDPLVGDQPRDFAFVLGIGEFLPFRNDLFDQVLFVTSLDHFIDPKPALLEARRVTRKFGEICVWFGEKDIGAPKPAKPHAWYEDLTIPEGAEDKFHFRRLTNNVFLEYLDKLKLNVISSHTQRVDEWRRNHFFKLRPISSRSL